MQKPIVQYDLSGNLLSEFSSIEEAVLKTGFSRDKITDTLYGKRLLNREFIWKFRDSLPKILSKRIDVVNPVPNKKLHIKRKRQYPYPYQDTFLHNLEGEVWKEVPVLERYCMVSNFGRVKSLPRIVERKKHGRVLIGEKIIKQGLEKSGLLNKNRGRVKEGWTSNNPLDEFSAKMHKKPKKVKGCH